MKKTLVALAALAVVGAASAQSSVTLYGAVDAALAGTTVDGGANRIGMINSGFGSSKLGFTGVEDLGGGLKANFKLEGGLANDWGGGKGGNTNNQNSGAAAAVGGGQGLVFGRFAYVGLSGGWGEVRLGNDYISTFLIQVSVDPMGTNGVADALNLLFRGGTVTGQTTVANARNMIGYTTPVIAGGLTANVQYWMGENAANGAGAGASGSGDGFAISARYGNGPIFVGLGTQTTRGTASGVATAPFGVLTTTGDFTSSSLAGSYDFGMAKVTYTYSRETVNDALATGTQLTNSTNHLGLVVPFGATTVKATYGRAVLNPGVAGVGDITGTLVAFGADYQLSKRTRLYGTWARVSNDTGVGVPNVFTTGGLGSLPVGQNGATASWQLGVFHSF